MQRHSLSSSPFLLGSAALFLALPLACGTAAEPQEDPCAPGGHLHDDHCHCDKGFQEVGLSCQPHETGRTDGGTTDAGTTECGPNEVPVDGGCAASDAGMGADPGTDLDGCGPHGELHHDHCHCESGYVEVDLECVAPPACEDDALEDNDTDGTPTEWTAAHEELTLMACVADDDWHTFPLQAGDTVRIDLLFAHAGGDLDMALWSPSNVDAPDAVGTSEDDDEQIVFTASESGQHYLLVFNATSNLSNSYSLRVTHAE